MNKAPSQALIEEVALLTSFPPTYIEKDWYVTQIIALLSKLKYENLNLVFAGGTALSKAHKVIQRMSEDVDFKVNVSQEFQSRKSLSNLKNYIANELENNDLNIAIAKIKARNENKLFSFEIDYPKYFEDSFGLRSHILLEFNVKEIRSEPVYKSVSSFINELTKAPAEVEQISCLNLTENSADKLSALCWRIPDRIRENVYDDPSIVRHLHDLAILKNIIINDSNLVSLVHRSIEDDINRSKHNLEYVNHLLEEKFTKMLSILKNDKEYAREYKYFIENMSYADPDSIPSFERAVQALEELTEQILQKEIKQV
jgi:predicted nucleotidyltransferase component of viral defense system